MQREKFLPELMAEKDTLDPSFVHAVRLLTEEIEQSQDDSTKSEEEKQYLDVISNKNIKLAERVLIPVKQYPKFNFVGKLLGPRGNSLKRLQEETGAKMSILGKGSMRDKAKEEELRKSGEAKYAHLGDDLHVLIEVFVPAGEAYSRMSHALEEVKKFLVPDYNDEIRQEQLRELSYLNGSEESPRGRGTRGRGIRPALTPTARGRASALLPGRGIPVPRGTPVARGAPSLSHPVRGTPAPRSRGGPGASGYRPPPPPEEDAYDEYGYDDGYGGEYDEQSYDTYDNSYASQVESGPEYYDYGHGTSEEIYESYGQEEWVASRPSLKAPIPRSRGTYREHPYGRY
ncbi:KH domain-containing, RNA-binding, signal transduction-associated protein 2 [Scyliorhinus canicula]|uniref:KH domain-containing, RNA-binding, signal transduction-associated protein 2 n=1 Tax=Scyliorhinus canicula TaxID=7830 RepID=UPI0018F5FCB6|nr:KH domain-containing, RNA-binding, signal transduction-associated protein 2 [Scyliorhinus canicula]